MALIWQEKVALVVFFLALVVIYAGEVFVLLKAMVAIVRQKPPRRILLARPAMVFHVLAVGGLLCMAYGRYIEPYWVEVNVHIVPTPALHDTPFRIVQISDLHCDTEVRNEEEMVRRIGRLKPDVIVATGDFLNDASALPLLKRTLSQLEAPLGKFAVTGNFEARRWSDLDLFAETGFRLLRQDTVSVTKDDETITISGLGFDRADGWPELLADLPEDRFQLFLYHMPDLIEDVADTGVDLYLCGHTHGGQVALPLYGALITFSKFGKKYESGLYQVGDTMLYVNRGLGFEPRPAPPVRFCARPEIAVFDLVPAKAPAPNEERH